MATAMFDDDEVVPLLHGDASTGLSLYPQTELAIALHMFPPGAPPVSLAAVTTQKAEPETKPRQPIKLTVTAEEAQVALLSHVAQHCCYSSQAAKEMIINDLRVSSAFKYTLETFTETRYLTDAHAPYKIEERIVRTKRGVDPYPWDVQGPSPTFFKDSTESLEVPSTAYVKGCHRCYGKGNYCCEKCRGRGKNPCSSCCGEGYRMEVGRQRQCTWCKGSGEDNFTCTVCNGRKQTTCVDCKGSGMIKCFTKLTIEWKTHQSQHAVECQDLPEELIKTVSGHVVFSEQNQQLLPIDHFPDRAVNDASRDLILEHQRSFKHQRVVMQRHSVTMVPVTEVRCSWKSRSFSFYVFGFEHKVYAPDYPQQCCCVIL